MKNYYRIMLGKGGKHAAEGRAGNFIGADFAIEEDLSGKFPDEWREFNRKYIPVFMQLRPEKTKISAGLAMGALWTICRGINTGDIVLCPDGQGQYMVGEVSGPYYHAPGQNLPHRRPVRWLDQTIGRADMSDPLRHSTGAIGTVSDVSRYADEIRRLIGDTPQPAIIATDEVIEDAATFALEKHLEDFLVENWPQTELAREYEIYREEGEVVGQQYRTDSGPIDILAVSKDKKRLLVVELKRGRASDTVVGQLLRYMGFVKEELAENGQVVHGVIIALEDDPKLRRALAATSNIEFYRYQVSFKLHKA